MTTYPVPDGWSPFGSHVGYDGPLEFSARLDDQGDPLWERHPEPEGRTDALPTELDDRG